MYEDKRTRLKIDWKSLIIKMAILMVVVFLFMWIASLIGKSNKKVASNIGENLKTMQIAAGEYFTGSRLPNRLNGKETLTLAEMINSKLIVEFKDQNGKACEKNESYAEATKISDDEYTIKVKLVCGKENDYVINTIKVENQLVDSNTDIEEPDLDNENQDNTDINTDNNVNEGEDNSNNQSNSSNNNQNNNTSGSTNNNKPSTSKPSTSKKPTITYVTTDKNNNSNNSSSTNNNSSSNNSSSQNNSNNSSNSQNNSSTNNNSSNNQNNNSNNQNNNTSSGNNSSSEEKDTCKYGTSDYVAVYPVAYLIGGKCAVSKDDYLKYSSVVNALGDKEREKLLSEMESLAKNAKTTLEVSNPIYSPVYNKSNTGLVGVQISFKVTQKITYTTKTIYQYYLDTNGNRKTIIDNRSSLKVTGSLTSNNTSSNIAVKGVSLNINSKELEIGDTYALKATVNPSNATNKNVTWTSNNTNVVSVDNNGKIKGLKAGKAVITAKSGSYRATATIEVKEAPFFKVNEKSLTLNVGDTKNITYSTNISGKASYSSSNTKVAKVSSTGKITAVSKGSATITVKLGNKKATISVKVNDNRYFSLAKGSATLNVGDTMNITYNTNMSGKASYSSSNTKVAKVSSTGKITAVSKGSATITVKLGDKKATMQVNVVTPYLEVVSGDGKNIDMYVGNDLQLFLDTNIEMDKITFTSSNTKVATISKTGRIKAVKNGFAIITVKSGNIERTLNLYVYKI